MGANDERDVSDVQGDSPGPMVSSDQTWKGASGNLFLIGMFRTTI